MDEHVLDASAMIALLWHEKGWDRVEPIRLRMASTVNVAEVGTILAHADVSLPDIRESIDSLKLTIIDFDREQAIEAARLRPLTRRWGLSLGDRACLALAGLRNLPVITADRNWSQAAPHLTITSIR